MGNSNATNQQEKVDDNLSNVSLNGSNCKEKLNESWKFSTLKDDEEKDSDNSNKVSVDGDLDDDEDEDDDDYNSTCEDTDNFNQIADKLKLNSILHIDDNNDDLETTNKLIDNKNLNLSPVSTTSFSSSLSQSESPKSVTDDHCGLNPNDTIENLALNLLNKLTFNNQDTPVTITDVTLTTTTSTTVQSTLKLPHSSEPAPPPSTPVSSVQESVCLNENLDCLLLCDKTKPQLIIDDVLLMSQEDGRPVVPLAEAEQSFNSIEQVKIGDESNVDAERVVVEHKTELKSETEVSKIEEVIVAATIDKDEHTTVTKTEPVEELVATKVDSSHESNEPISDDKIEPAPIETIVTIIEKKIENSNPETTLENKIESPIDHIENKTIEDVSKETHVETEGNPNSEEIENKGEEKTAFMMLIDKIASHSNLIEHHFEYEIPTNEIEHIHSVTLTGSFNNWQQFLTMNKIEGTAKWYKDLMLAPGDYEYKFVINDNDWRCNPNLPTNGLNNILNLTK